MFHPDHKFRWMCFYYLVMLWIWRGVIVGIGDMIFGYTLSIWYFTRNHEALKLPILRTTRDVFKYHIGSIVYHTFVTSFCTLLQIILAYIYNTLKNAKQYSNVARFSMAFFQCHLRVYQNYFRYLSKHNLIQVAMWSDDYMTAGEKQYFLLWRNHHRVIKGGM